MRLIDADNLTQRLSKTAAEASDPALSLAVGLIVQILAAEPTAYDVDRVVEELEAEENDALMRTGNWEDSDPYYDGQANAYRRAVAKIKAAKRGATP